VSVKLYTSLTFLQTQLTKEESGPVDPLILQVEKLFEDKKALVDAYIPIIAKLHRRVL
jgi:hypothetical protein